MKLSEAIKRAQIMVNSRKNRGYYHETGALQLLIEAGKRVVWHKAQHKDGYYELLPGETKE